MLTEYLKPFSSRFQTETAGKALVIRQYRIKGRLDVFQAWVKFGATTRNRITCPSNDTIMKSSGIL
jgi:hypothetical protein